jgi:hypothetical protein
MCGVLTCKGFISLNKMEIISSGGGKPPEESVMFGVTVIYDGLH